MGCVVKKASHGIRLGRTGSGCLCWVDHGARWMGLVVYMRTLYHVYMRGIWMDEFAGYSNWLGAAPLRVS